MKSILLIFTACLSAIAQLQIENEDANYLPYEPIYLSIEYQGDKPLSTNLNMGQVILTVTNLTTMEKRQYTPFVLFDAGTNEMKVYKSSSIMGITSDKFGWLFGNSGSYNLVATAPDYGLRSNEIVITIDDPETAQDKAVCKQLSQCPGMESFLKFEGGDMFEEASALAESIANGSSSYKLSFMSLVAKNYSQQSYSRSKGVRKPDLRKAMAYTVPINKQRDDRKNRHGKSSNARYLSHINTLNLLDRISGEEGKIFNSEIQAEIESVKSNYKNFERK